MNGQCEYELDGYDVDGTPWYRCTTHDSLEISDEAPCAAYQEIPYTPPCQHLNESPTGVFDNDGGAVVRCDDCGLLTNIGAD